MANVALRKPYWFPVLWPRRSFLGSLPSSPGTGHHYGGLSLLPGSLLLDLAALDTVHVDPAARTAAVGPGATGRALAEALARHGLHFPLPHISAVGLGGFLLGGYGSCWARCCGLLRMGAGMGFMPRERAGGCLVAWCQRKVPGGYRCELGSARPA